MDYDNRHFSGNHLFIFFQGKNCTKMHYCHYMPGVSVDAIYLISNVFFSDIMVSEDLLQSPLLFGTISQQGQDSGTAEVRRSRADRSSHEGSPDDAHQRRVQVLASPPGNPT